MPDSLPTFKTPRTCLARWFFPGDVLNKLVRMTHTRGHLTLCTPSPMVMHCQPVRCPGSRRAARARGAGLAHARADRSLWHRGTFGSCQKGGCKLKGPHELAIMGHNCRLLPLDKVSSPQQKKKEPLRRACPTSRLIWCLLFVLIRQGLRGGSGPLRLIRAPGIETGNPIMTFEKRSSFLPSFERAPHHTSPRIP